MKFKTKLRKIGNSIGIYIPRDAIGNYKIGDEIELDTIGVITKQDTPVITKELFNTELCSKHPGSMKGTCGCK